MKWILCFSLVACAHTEKTLLEKKADEIAIKTQETETQKNKTIENMQIQQAKMWTHIEELESLVNILEEKTHLLEQGLAMGMVPEKLKNFDESQEASKPSSEVSSKKYSESSSKKSSDASPPSTSITSEEEPKMNPKQEELKSIYLTKFVQARDLFTEGRYGKAYIEFTKLDKEFDLDLTQSEPKYWLGRCWLKLKEYQTAKQFFSNFLSEQPSNPLTPSAQYYLAQTEFKLDMTESAVKRLEEILKNQRDEGTSEAARQLLAQIQKKF